jgi:RNA polymerase sigma-70 factor (ECF subfamily)
MEETGVPGPRGFEPTRWSLVLGAQKPEDPAYLGHWEALIGLYWRPVYRTVRFRWNKPVEEAQDLTQAFFAGLFEEGLGTVHPGRGRFRSFLRAALDNFLRNDRRDSRRLKRGGGIPAIRLEDDVVVAPGEDLFEREWRRCLFEKALQELEAQERPEWAACFRRYYLVPTPPAYRELAEALGLAEHDVANHLRSAKAAMRERVRRLVRESCASDVEFEEEMRELFG